MVKNVSVAGNPNYFDGKAEAPSPRNQEAWVVTVGSTRVNAGDLKEAFKNFVRWSSRGSFERTLHNWMKARRRNHLLTDPHADRPGEISDTFRTALKEVFIRERPKSRAARAAK